MGEPHWSSRLVKPYRRRSAFAARPGSTDGPLASVHGARRGASPPAHVPAASRTARAARDWSTARWPAPGGRRRPATPRVGRSWCSTGREQTGDGSGRREPTRPGWPSPTRPALLRAPVDHPPAGPPAGLPRALRASRTRPARSPARAAWPVPYWLIDTAFATMLLLLGGGRRGAGGVVLPVSMASAAPAARRPRRAGWLGADRRGRPRMAGRRRPPVAVAAGAPSGRRGHPPGRVVAAGLIAGRRQGGAAWPGAADGAGARRGQTGPGLGRPTGRRPAQTRAGRTSLIGARTTAAASSS